MAKHKSNKRFAPKHIKQFADRMRQHLSPRELKFLRRLTLANVAPFDFQVRIGFYVADFVFPTKMLIIEIDGPSHDERVEHDEKRDAWLLRAGFTTWRIKNSETANWPLSRITNHERPAEGRGYVDAIKWANAHHDEATARERGKQPPPILADERKEDFYKRLMAKTARVQQAERDRREMYARERELRTSIRSR